MAPRRMNLLLVSCFALLQCVAPLAHAHISGISADQHAHLFEMPASAPHTQNVATIESDESLAIGVAAGLVRDDYNPSPDQPLAILPVGGNQTYRNDTARLTLPLRSVAIRASRALPYQLPNPQAPPRG